MSTTSAAPPRPRLTQVEKRAVTLAAAGWSNDQIARQLRSPPGKVTRLLSGLSETYGTGESRPALIRAALADRLVVLPAPGRPAPHFTDPELLLGRAIAHQTGPHDVTASAHVDQLTDPVAQTGRLVGKARARNATHLVALLDAWDLLDPEHHEGDPR
ncbi:hypothetical protein [Streptomyces sp. NPDC050428]|uniref:hypothetical protein n=1 Tax=Streptomyces sp. NPDC050428 TaxID=3155757 RepID=UPI003446532D